VGCLTGCFRDSTGGVGMKRWICYGCGFIQDRVEDFSYDSVCPRCDNGHMKELPKR